MLFPPYEIYIFFCFFLLYSRSCNSFQSCQESLVNLLFFLTSRFHLCITYQPLDCQKAVFSCETSVKSNSDGDLQKQCFPIGRRMVQKLPYFRFASSKCRKVFPTLLAEMWWKIFPLHRFRTYTEVKDSTVFLHCASCSAQEISG